MIFTFPAFCNEYGEMTEACRYFDSTRWDDRIESYACRAWDFETFLRNAEAKSFDKSMIDRVARLVQEYTATELAVADVGEIIELAAEVDIDISRTAVRDAWLAANEDTIPSTCPHSVAAEHDEFCQFHMSPAERREANIAPSAVADAIEQQVRSVGGQAKQFVGAHFQQLDLSSRKLSAKDNDPIDFRYIIVEEGSSFTETIFSHDVWFKGAVFKCREADTDHTNLTFGDHYIEFEGQTDWMRAVFKGDADFKFAVFEGNIRFNSATFERAAMFNYGRFGAKCDFMGASFDGKADFSKAHFDAGAYMNGEYNSASIFNYTYFGGQVDFWSTTFEAKAEFWGTTFDGPVDASYAEFNGETRFTGATFEDVAAFNHAMFQRTVVFKRVSGGMDWIDLEQANISEGVFAQPDDIAFFDLTQATIGEVTLGTDTQVDPHAFEYLRIRQTRFDEFDFASYTYALKPDWRIHTNDPPGVEAPFEAPSEHSLKTLNTLEQTYLRAKNGATDVGHNLAASHFFHKEMSYRRHQHWRRMFRDSFRSRVKAFWRWGSNQILNITSGYGERPSRTIGISILTIIGFALIYWVLPSTPDYGGRFGQGYLLISLQSFITFILGSAPVGATPNVQFVSAVEGFIGAFFIALLVFTLTRSIHR